MQELQKDNSVFCAIRQVICNLYDTVLRNEVGFEMKNMFYLCQGQQTNLGEGASESFSWQVQWNWNGFFQLEKVFM